MKSLFLSITISFLVAFSAQAKCLSSPDFDRQCRYPQGDSWCAEHEARKPYAYSDTCLSNLASKAIQPSFSRTGLIALRQGMDYSQAREIILGSGWQGKIKRWQEVNDFGNEKIVYNNNGWREVEGCSGTGMALCRFEFVDLDLNTLVVITEGECMTKSGEYPENGEKCDVTVRQWFLE